MAERDTSGVPGLQDPAQVHLGRSRVELAQTATEPQPVRSSSGHDQRTHRAGLARGVPGSLAVAAGLLTPDRLRGPRFRRLLPDVYIPTRVEPPDLLLRSLAAYRLVEGRGVLAGYSAAALLDAHCAPHPDAPPK